MPVSYKNMIKIIQQFHQLASNKKVSSNKSLKNNRIFTSGNESMSIHDKNRDKIIFFKIIFNQKTIMVTE